MDHLQTGEWGFAVARRKKPMAARAGTGLVVESFTSYNDWCDRLEHQTNQHSIHVCSGEDTDRLKMFLEREGFVSQLDEVLGHFHGSDELVVFVDAAFGALCVWKLERKDIAGRIPSQALPWLSQLPTLSESERQVQAARMALALSGQLPPAAVKWADDDGNFSDEQAAAGP